MYESIQVAQKSIYLETYIFRNDVPGFDFLEALVKKAREGVRVVMLVDGIGSVFFSLGNQQKLERAGGEVEFSFNILHRIHRKILIIDEQIAFVGGVNFGKRFVGWSDLHVKVAGGVVRSALRSFAYSYKLAGGKDPYLIALALQTGLQKTRSKFREVKHAFIEHWPFRGKGVLKMEYLRRIRGAKESITIVSPYFVPHRWLTRAIIQAVRRGVTVKVITSRRSDVLVAKIANLAYATELTKFGIKFFFTDYMLHAKVLFVDGREGLVGSHNVDAMSFDFNLEASLHFARKDMAGDIRKILAGWQEDATPFEEILLERKWYYAIVEWVIKLFQPIL